MAPKQSAKNDPSTPDQFSVQGGGIASKDYLFEILQRLTSIESSVSFITAAVDDSKAKIEAVSKDVTEAKAKFDTLKSVVSWASKGVWAVFGLLLTFALTVLGMWLKHRNGW